MADQFWNPGEMGIGGILRTLMIRFLENQGAFYRPFALDTKAIPSIIRDPYPKTIDPRTPGVGLAHGGNIGHGAAREVSGGIGWFVAHGDCRGAVARQWAAPARNRSPFGAKEKRLMRKFTGWVLLAGLCVGLPAPATAQLNYPVPPVDFTGPLSHPRYETGGFFVGLAGKFYRQTRPLKNQPIAFRGFTDFDGTANGVGLPPGTFVGSGSLALTTQNLRGPGTYQPGTELTLGWLFENEVAVSVSWVHLWDARYSATATLAPPGLRGGLGLEDTFLTSPVYNFPIDYAGNPQNLAQGNPGATFGIWNAASQMTIDFVQRYDAVELSARIPIAYADNHRFYGLIGPRAVTLWERFKWRTVDADASGLASELTTAYYTNVVSNRLYGVHLGCGNDWFLGDTPIGAFSVTLDAQAALYLDFAKGRAKYELADRSTAASRARNFWSLVPGVEANLKLWWFPWEGVQMSVGYDFISFFNTYSSPQPVDFNYGAIDPEFEAGTLRWLHGLQFGIAFVF